MLNSPVLDTAIGLVFIFLLYSLLATSINELIATLFSMRARMLKKGIIEGMLSDSKHDDWLWLDTLKGIGDIIIEPLKLLVGYKPIPKEKKLGDKIYDHPIVKNYGANNRYKTPSYISKQNFSTVLIEVLQQYWADHKDKIGAKYPTLNLDDAPTITKIYYLVEYLQSDEAKSLKTKFQTDQIDIDDDTLKILELYLKKSYLNLELFTKEIESWYDDSMNRIAGWYKRQVQLVLFIIGLSLAMLFNVNIIQVASKLSTDKDARDKLVEMAIKNVDKLEKNYKDAQAKKEDSAYVKNLEKKFQDEQANTKKLLEGDVADANNLLALGWGDYGYKENRKRIISENREQYKKIYASLCKSDCTNYIWTQKIARAKTKNKRAYNKIEKLYMKEYTLNFHDRIGRTDRAYEVLFNSGVKTHKIQYVISKIFTINSLLGYLLLAIGICLGAPFWFDLLQKFIKIRGSGQKETTEAEEGKPAQPAAHPLQVNVNNSTNPEAIG
jgi:hypothetical protein